MFRYIALVWNTGCLSEAAAATSFEQRIVNDSRDWKVALRKPGFALYCSGFRSGSSEPYYLYDEAGVVLGTVVQSYR